MRSTKLGFLAAIASSVAAQNALPISFADFPKCALNAGIQAVIGTGCGTNVSCVCRSTTFIADVVPAVNAACSPSDLQKAIQAAVQLCSEYGDTITIPNLESSTSTPIPVTASPAASTTLETSTSSALLSDSSSTTTASTEGITSTSPPAIANSTNGTISASAISSIATKTTLTKGTTSTSAALSTVTAKSASAQGTWATTGLLGFGVLLMALPALAGIA